MRLSKERIRQLEAAAFAKLRGKRLVHLQCNAGQDTLSLAARGARVTGVDISDYGKDLPGAPKLGAMMKRLLALAHSSMSQSL